MVWETAAVVDGADVGIVRFDPPRNAFLPQYPSIFANASNSVDD